MSQERVDRILAGYQQFNEGKIDDALVGVSDDFEWVTQADFPDPGPFRGRDGVRRAWETWFETFEHFRAEILDVHDLDDHVVVMVRIHGTGRDSGADVTTPTFPQVWTFRGDEIVSAQMFADEEAVREAIGKDWRPGGARPRVG